MIRLYDRTEINYNHNKNILTPISCSVEEEANGMFELEAEFPKNINIENGAVIKAPTPRGEQLFRVYKSFKTLKNKKVYARHFFYDLSKNFLINVNLENVSCFTAVQAVLSNTESQHNFTGTSDIGDISSILYERINPIQAIIGDDNSILNTYGGNLVRDNFNIKIQANGLDRGYEIRMGKNLIGIECDNDESNVKTRIYPIVVLGDNDTIYSLPEKYIDSPLINYYGDPIIYTEEVPLTDEQKELSIEEIYAIMRDYCDDLFEVDNVDKPVINYKIDFVELSKTEQYKNFAILEKLDLYDIVTCNVSNLNINVKARVIKYKYDCLKERYDSIELGDFKATSSYQTDNIVKQLNDKIKVNETAVEYATNVITGNQGGYLVTRRYPDGKPYELLVMDTEDINTATNVFRLNNSGLGFSRNGYNGLFSTAMTIDGHIVADYMDTGTLTSILLKSSNYVQNISGTKINLMDGTIDTKNFKVTANGDGTFSGALQAASGTFKGSLQAASGTFTGDLVAAGGTFSGDLQAVGGTFSGNLSAAGGTFTGTLVGVDGTFSGTLSGNQIHGGTISGSKILSSFANGSDTITLQMSDVAFNVGIVAGGSSYDSFLLHSAVTFSSGANSSYASYGRTGITMRNSSGNYVFSVDSSGDIECGDIICDDINGGTPITSDNRNSFYYNSNHINPIYTGGGSGPNVGLNGVNIPTVNWCNDTFQKLSSSDFRLKKDIASVDDSIDRFYFNLKPKSYRFKEDDSKVHIGLLAQEVSSNLINSGLGEDYAILDKRPVRTYTDEGQYIDDAVYRVEYEELTTMTVYEVQKLKAENEQLHNKLEELEQRLIKLEVA